MNWERGCSGERVAGHAQRAKNKKIFCMVLYYYCIRTVLEKEKNPPKLAPVLSRASDASRRREEPR